MRRKRNEKISDVPKHSDLRKKIGEIKTLLQAQDSYLYRSARMRKNWGLWWAAISIGLAPAGTIIPIEFLLLYFLCVSGLSLGGILYAMAGMLFEKVHHQDPNLSLLIDQIGGFLVPLDNKWIKQWEAGKSCSKFRMALVIELFAITIMLWSLASGFRLAMEASKY